MENNDIFKILHRHKREIVCDLCHKRFWFFQKIARNIVRMKDNIWVEYYHIKCLEKRGFIRRKKEKAGRFDNKDEQGASNVVH